MDFKLDNNYVPQGKWRLEVRDGKKMHLVLQISFNDGQKLTKLLEKAGFR